MAHTGTGKKKDRDGVSLLWKLVAAVGIFILIVWLVSMMFGSSDDASDTEAGTDASSETKPQARFAEDVDYMFCQEGQPGASHTDKCELRACVTRYAPGQFLAFTVYYPYNGKTEKMTFQAEHGVNTFGSRTYNYVSVGKHTSPTPKGLLWLNRTATTEGLPKFEGWSRLEDDSDMYTITLEYNPRGGGYCQ